MKPDYVRTFLHASGKSLRNPTPRTEHELDDATIEKGVRSFWKLLENLRRAGAPDGEPDSAARVSFDEKPLWIERIQRVWRETGKPEALVKSVGKTRQRETVRMRKLGMRKLLRPNKLPLILIFPGTNQLHVDIPEGYPCLIMFTPKGTMNNKLLIHIFKRAIIPNLDDSLTHFFGIWIRPMCTRTSEVFSLKHQASDCNSFPRRSRSQFCRIVLISYVCLLFNLSQICASWRCGFSQGFSGVLRCPPERGQKEAVGGEKAVRSSQGTREGPGGSWIPHFPSARCST